jgi:hypothetical protein
LGKGSAWGAQQPDGGKSYENKGSDPLHTESLTEYVGEWGVWVEVYSTPFVVLTDAFTGPQPPRDDQAVRRSLKDKGTRYRLSKTPISPSVFRDRKGKAAVRIFKRLATKY